MSKGVCIVFLVLVPWLACEQRSENPLPPDPVLIDLVYDLHLAEASMTRVAEGKQDSISEVIRARIASSYGISATEMDIWLETLQKSPEHLIVVYDSVIARLEKAKDLQ